MSRCSEHSSSRTLCDRKYLDFGLVAAYIEIIVFYITLNASLILHVLLTENYFMNALIVSSV